MKQIASILIVVVMLAACKKNYDAEATYAKATIAATWAKNEPFYQPLGERFDETTGTWRTFRSFSFTSEADPDKLSFANPYVPGKGTNALDMNRLYSTQNLTSDSGYYNITIPKCFQFIPNANDLTTGKVIVLPQTIKIWRRDKTSFDIKIAPGTSDGTYNTITKIFEIEISFDETSIGGGAAVKRKYRFTA